MRTFVMITTMILAALLITNCGEKKKDERTLSADCFYKQTNQSVGTQVSGCNFNYSAYEGFENYSRTYNNNNYNYGYNYGYNSGYYDYRDGCPSSHELVYSGEKGLGCVEAFLLPFGQAVRYVLNANTGEFTPTYDNYSFNQTSVMWACENSDDCEQGTCRGLNVTVNQGIGVCYR